MKKPILLIIIITISTSLFSQPCYPEGITFTTQTEIDDFQTLNPDCTQIEGTVIISGNDIINVDSLMAITSIGGDLKIDGNNNLSSIEGLSNLTYIGGSLIIEDNHSLTSFTGLEGVDTIFGNLRLYYNVPGITNLVGLNGITAIYGYLKIEENYYLKDLSGLDSLITLGGNLYIGYNNQLEDLEGLNGLSAIGGYCVIQDNMSLKNIDGLSSLTSISDELAIIENDSLTSISGIENIEANTITELFMQFNYMLAECSVLSICDYLASPNGPINIYSNASGCNSQEEVEFTCGLVYDAEVPTSDDMVIFPNPANGHFKLKSESTINNIAVYNLAGELIMVKEPHTKVYQLVTSNLVSGVYQLRITTESGILSKRIYIQ